MFDMTTETYCPHCRKPTTDDVSYNDGVNVAGNSTIPKDMLFRIKYCTLCNTYKGQEVIKKELIKE